MELLKKALDEALKILNSKADASQKDENLETTTDAHKSGPTI